MGARSGVVPHDCSTQHKPPTQNAKTNEGGDMIALDEVSRTKLVKRTSWWNNGEVGGLVQSNNQAEGGLTLGLFLAEGDSSKPHHAGPGGGPARTRSPRRAGGGIGTTTGTPAGGCFPFTAGEIHILSMMVKAS